MATRTVTVKPAAGDYTTLALAIAGEVAANADLTTDNGSGSAGILNIEISGNWSGSPDTDAVNVTGFTQSADYYLHIYTDSANVASTKLDATRYQLATTGLTLVLGGYTRVTGLQLDVTHTGAVTRSTVSSSAALGVQITNCLITMSGQPTGANSHAVQLSGATAANPCLIRNSVIYDAVTDGMTLGGENNSYFVHNNTIVDSGDDGMYSGYNDVNVSNNAVFGSGGSAFNGTYNGGNNNAYGSGADPATAGVNISGDAGTDLFLDYNGNDFAVKDTGSSLYDAAIDLSGHGTAPVSDDINGTARSQWDIGAHEYVAAGGSIVVLRRRRSSGGWM